MVSPYVSPRMPQVCPREHERALGEVGPFVIYMALYAAAGIHDAVNPQTIDARKSTLVQTLQEPYNLTQALGHALIEVVHLDF